MKHPLVASLLLCLMPMFAMRAANNEVPETPAVLKAVEATLVSIKGELTLSVRSKTPLTSAQWEAVEALKPKHLRFNGNALDDGGMDRLVKLDPITVGINENSALTGLGVAKFGQMKSLVGLGTNHSVQPTPESREAFSHHPTLESFSTVGPFCIEALLAPKLKRATLEHGSARDEFIATLAHHPAVESLSLGRWGGSTMTDAAIESLATIKTLQKLEIYICDLTWKGGLHHLKELPNLTELALIEVELPPGDLETIKAELAKVKVTHTGMTPEAKAKRDRAAALRARVH